MRKRIKVVMIDRNCVIDRRIILEAEELIQHGFDVELLIEDAGGSEPWIESPKFPVVRFSTSPNENHTKSESAAIADIQRFKDRWGSWIGIKLALLIGSILMPSSGSRFVIRANSLSRWQMFGMLGILSLLSGGSVPERFSNSRKWLTKSWRERSLGAASLELDPWGERAIAHLRKTKFDVIHVHDLPALPFGFQIKKEFGKKLVYDAHELYAHLPGLSQAAQTRLKSLESRFIHEADHVVVINEEQAALMVEAYGLFPYTCLTNATKAPDNFDPLGKHDALRKKFSIPESSKILFFQGVINRVRKIDVLLQGVALSKSKPHIVFLTWGAQEIAEFRGFARDLGIESRVHFHEPVSWEKVIEIAASSDVGVMPYQAKDLNTKISSPNKMYEFIMAGVPMLGSAELVNVKKTVGDLGLGIVAELKEPEDYAAAIDAMLIPNDSNWKKAKANILRVRDQFTWKALSKDFVNFYERLSESSSESHGAISIETKLEGTETISQSHTFGKNIFA